MKKVVLLMGVGICIVLGLVRFVPRRQSSFETLHVSGRTLFVEVANTPASISKGLGERDAIGSDGMLFLLPSRQIPRFWMKGMRFDLDFVWIDGTVIVDLTANVKAEPGMPESRLSVYTPKVPVTKVLELPSGSIELYQLQIGEEITP